MNWQEFCRNADRLLFRQLNVNHHNDQGGSPMSQATLSGVVNGVDVERLGATIQAIQQTPTLAASQFRAKNRWIMGGHNRSTIQGFYGAGQEDTTRTNPFVLDADEPPVLLGKDQGANPAEYVLHALAACLTTSLVYHAAARGIRLESVESHLEGDLDLQGFLGISDKVRQGYKQIRAQFTVKSDASPEQLQELTKYSPVYDIVSNPVPVSISVRKI
ncbi:MAG TPA: OsmC family protein [Nitrospiraceae bacterium]|nr:OsmC family protein [Nitrospiraceae bacterium]